MPLFKKKAEMPTPEKLKQDKAVVPLCVSTASQTRTVCGFSGFKKWYYFLNGSTTLPPTIS